MPPKKPPPLGASPPAKPISAAPASDNCIKGLAAIATATPTAPARPPKKPDQVLFGEYFGQSLGPFSALPTRKAKMSQAQVTANSITVQPAPWFVALSQIRAKQAGAM